jgi:hypothetical protein
MPKDAAQVSLEMAVAVVVMLTLFLGCVRLFFWVNGRMVLRQEEYEASRAPGHYGYFLNDFEVIENNFKNLKLVGQ